MSKDPVILKWKEPVEYRSYLALKAKSGPGDYAVRIAVLLLFIAVPLGLAIGEIWFGVMAFASLGAIWFLRGHWLLQRLGFDGCQRVELDEKRFKISYSTGICWIPIKDLAEYSISDWNLGSYTGHKLVLKVRRNWAEIWTGIPAGFDVENLRNQLDRLGLKCAALRLGRAVPPPLRPQS